MVAILPESGPTLPIPACLVRGFVRYPLAMNASGAVAPATPVPLAPADAEDHTAVFTWIVASLRSGTLERESVFHAPALATVDGGGTPDVRTVVLQQVESSSAGQLALICHTHVDAGKVRHLRERPEACWHVYDRSAKTQVVLSGPTTVHVDDELAEERWAATRSFSRVCYTRPLPPGLPKPPEPGRPLRPWLARVL